MSLGLVEKRANRSLSRPFFPIQRHIILPAAGGTETDGQASKPPALSHFLPPSQKKSNGVIWSPARSLESLPHTRSGRQHLSPALVSSWGGRVMPPALQVNVPAGRQPSEHHRHQQTPRSRRSPVPARWVASAAAFQRPLLRFALNFLPACEKQSDKSRAVGITALCRSSAHQPGPTRASQGAVRRFNEAARRRHVLSQTLGVMTLPCSSRGTRGGCGGAQNRVWGHHCWLNISALPSPCNRYGWMGGGCGAVGSWE